MPGKAPLKQSSEMLSENNQPNYPKTSCPQVSTSRGLKFAVCIFLAELLLRSFQKKLKERSAAAMYGQSQRHRSPVWHWSLCNFLSNSIQNKLSYSHLMSAELMNWSNSNKCCECLGPCRKYCRLPPAGLGQTTQQPRGLAAIPNFFRVPLSPDQSGACQLLMQILQRSILKSILGYLGMW